MFRIKAEYSEQLEFKASIARAREFFTEWNNFVDLMPGIESIRAETSGLLRWTVRADIGMLGSMREAFALELTADGPDRVEWSPATTEKKNYLRYAVNFIERGATSTIVRITQHVEMRRQNARDLHMLAGLVGENRISAEMQKRITEMIRTFLERARGKLEG